MLTTLAQNMPFRRTAKAKTQKMRGAVAVELALLLVFILVPLIFGIADLGRMLYQYNALTKAVRDGAKLMSLCDPAFPDYATYQTQARRLVVYGNTAGTGEPLVTGLEVGDVDIDQLPPIGTVKLVRVTVSDFSLGYITGLPYILGISDLQSFSDISITMRQSETCDPVFS